MLQNLSSYRGYPFGREAMFFHLSPEGGTVDMEGFGSFQEIPSVKG
jgi:hypothetical protein